ncbi:MAG: hypothetical protein LE178_03160 [Endomicrobium sp.]|nr:hypothetical protein [Endomicrobium sp.]
MKKIIYVVLLMFLSSPSFCVAKRYVVFFAETSDISNVVVDKILLSNRFCMNVPVNDAVNIPENLEELISYGKIEVALSFNPEPVLPIFAMLSNVELSKSQRHGIFEEYVVNNLTRFESNTNKGNSCVFLNCAEMSYDVLYYFARLKLSWINVDNLEENARGAYVVDGITIFSLYKDFPYNQTDVMKWLESKPEDIIPVLLTKKHLQNVMLMEYLITTFDNSKYIYPATPMYVSKVKSDLLQQKTVYFKQVAINKMIMDKLFSAANLIVNYTNTSNFKEYVYNNARSELIYLCNYNLLKDVSFGVSNGKRMFDATYDNIHRLLGAFELGENKISESYVYSDEKNISISSNKQTSVELISDGISINNDGLLKSIQVIAKNNNIKINFSFKDDKWDDNIAFIDFYIDLNNIDGAGSTSLLSGVNGFLTTESGWEYSLRIYKDKAVLYKYSSDGASYVSNLIVDGDASILIPQKYIRGNPSRWGYQSIAIAENNGKKVVIDFLNQSDKTKDEILSATPFLISAVRH